MVNFIKPIGWLLLLLPFFSFHPPDAAVAPATAWVAPPYPTDYFSNPLKETIMVTGTFGELRSNHFHSGLDMRSKNGAVGQPVYAAAEGYVDQIKVQSYGYGHVLYLKHPNGYSTVYAHLDRFAPELAEYVKQVQYERERFEVTIDLPQNKFKVAKGQEIGKLGNTGGSTGPHLHFEIRYNGRPINPLLFGLPVPDTKAPDIRDMKIYTLAEDRSVYYSQALSIEKRGNNQYGLKGGASAYRIGAWRVGLGIKVYDQSNALKNDNGIFKLEVLVNGQLVHRWTADNFAFDETRYLNALCDYAANKRYGAWFHRLFVLPGDKLSMYDTTPTLGAIPLSVSEPSDVVVNVSDAAGNVSSVKFTLYRDENMQVPPARMANQTMEWQRTNNFEAEGCKLNVPAGALYEDLPFEFVTTPDNSDGFYSPVYHLHQPSVPVHRYMDVSLDASGVPEQLRDKAVIARCDSRKPDNCGGVFKNGRLSTAIRSFGDYCIMVDNQAPVITPIVFDDDMRRKSAMAFRVTDNFNVTDRGDELNWRGTVDGQWVLFEYDPKRNRLTHTFDGRIGPGQHQLRLVVKDDRGNTTVFEQTFLR
jgi:Peptidase family M23